MIRRDVEILLDGPECLYDQIHCKLKGENSPYIKNIKNVWPINERLREEEPEIEEEEKQQKKLVVQDH